MSADARWYSRTLTVKSWSVGVMTVMPFWSSVATGNRNCCVSRRSDRPSVGYLAGGRRRGRGGWLVGGGQGGGWVGRKERAAEHGHEQGTAYYCLCAHAILASAGAVGPTRGRRRAGARRGRSVLLI